MYFIFDIKMLRLYNLHKQWGEIMKLLSIGNSFSTDAQKWLHQIAKSCGDDLYAANLYIGGCSLEMHWENFNNKEPRYDYEINGECLRKISLIDGLKAEEWDVITFQQVSHLSGDYSTYQPFLDNLYAEVKKICPDAKFYIQQTWAYEKDTNHPGFANYENSQAIMHEMVARTYKKAAEHIGADVIPTGEAIDYLRKSIPEFDYGNGGMSLCRDTFHLSYTYGRYAAGLVWYNTLFEKDVRKTDFCPVHEGVEADKKVIDIIKNAVYSALSK